MFQAEERQEQAGECVGGVRSVQEVAHVYCLGSTWHRTRPQVSLSRQILFPELDVLFTELSFAQCFYHGLNSYSKAVLHTYMT